MILTKRNAVGLPDAALSKPGWRASALTVSGNTDCYQPIERVERLTPDLDPLGPLAADGLVHVALSMHGECGTAHRNHP